MGNSCPPCQCNTDDSNRPDSNRPYYDLMKVSLKQMQCIPEDTSKQMTPTQNQDFMDCMKKHQTELTAALMKTDCPNVKWERNEFPKCMQTLSEEKRNNALKECNDAVSDYLKTPGARASFNPGQGAIQVNQLCTRMFEVSKP